MTQDMTLLWASGSPSCWRVQIALEEKNLQGYAEKQLSFDKMEHKSKEVMDMNPRGQLPVFKHGDRVLNESYAVCLYLESQFKSQGTKLIPDSPGEMAMMYQRMFEGFTLADKMSNVIHYTKKDPKGESPDSDIDDSQRNSNKEALTAELKLWEGYLKKDCCYMVGKTFSMADVVLFPTIAYLMHLGLCGEHYPKLTAYYNCVKDRPSIKTKWPPSWKEDHDTPGQDLPKTI